MLKSFARSLDRNACLAGYSDLTQTAPIAFEGIFFFDILSGTDQVFPAFFLVMPGLGDGSDWTALDAFAAGPVCKKQTIGSMIGLGTGCRLDGYSGDHGTDPHGFAPGGNESVTQPKGTKSRGMGRMAFRPGRGAGKSF